MPINFHVAAEASEPSADEKVVEVPIGDRVFIARRPTIAQTALLNLGLTAPDISDRIVAVFKLTEAIIGTEARDLIEELFWARRIDITDMVGGSEQNKDGGLLDQIFAEFAGFPTEPSTASSASRNGTGRKSGARRPGPGSIPSP
jgi:hypothetical protein